MQFMPAFLGPAIKISLIAFAKGHQSPSLAEVHPLRRACEMPLLVVHHRSGDLFVACLWEQQSRREATEMDFE